MGPALSVGAVANKLLEINATDAFGLIVAKNIGRAARWGAVPVFVRGPATLCRASFLSCSNKTAPAHRATPLRPFSRWLVPRGPMARSLNLQIGK
jgi:hypothetical protein